MAKADAVFWGNAIFASIGALWLAFEAYGRHGRLSDALVAIFTFLTIGWFAHARRKATR